MKYFIATVFALLLFVPLVFSDTWIGGNGDWNDPANWFDGSIPTANDAVMIASGSVQIPSGYTAYANRVQLFNGAGLTINSGGGRLIVDAASSTTFGGITIDGSLDVHGFLILRNVNSGVGMVIQPNSSCHIHSTAYFTLKNIATSDGILVSPGGLFTNDGNMFISNIDNHGIMIGGGFINTGSIDILSAYSGISTSQGSFENSGAVSIKGMVGSGLAFVNGGSGYNEEDGEIVTSYVQSGVVVNSPNAFFGNHGVIRAEWQIGNSGVASSGAFVNHEQGLIMIDNSGENGISTYLGGIFDNNGEIIIGEHIQAYAIDNMNYFYNLPCGQITMHSPVYNAGFTYTTFSNEGEIYNYNTSGSSYNYSTFINEGVIEDNPGTLLPVVTNDEVIATALTGNVQVGVPVSNVLDLGTIDHYIVKGFYTSSALTASAGTYNIYTNQWTPNAAAEGLTEVYLHVGYRLNYTVPCTSVVKVEIPNGVQPFTSSSPFGPEAITTEKSTQKILVYPNPFQQSLHLQIPADITGEHTLSIHNSMGSLVCEQSLIVEPGHFTLESLSELVNGTYMLSISKNGSTIWQDRIVKLD
ncbi:MAG: T9SS type A sorting domain-containing protein [Chitinophagales bacterium]|nr:T9SS type A sorting domain-containing protein [Chitinophagales bacterium]